MKKYPSLLTCILISSLLLSLTGAARLKQTNSLTLKEWEKEPLSVTGLKWIVHAFQGSQDNLPEENADASSGSSSSAETAEAQANSSSADQPEGQNGSSTQNPAQSGASSSGLLAGQDHSSSESGRTDSSADENAPAPAPAPEF
ncbi:MAG: hypothetical protein HXK90_10980, partial [Lachnospiraceae bacterium]|nr:hypothetical protein [Lachnospiraceae bacterium]